MTAALHRHQARLETVNARIESARLGVEDHGILTFYLDLVWDVTVHCAFGGFALDTYDSSYKKRIGHAFGSEAIRALLDVVGVAWWSELKGSYVRIKTEGGWGGHIRYVGNIVADRWLSLEELAEEVSNRA